MKNGEHPLITIITVAYNAISTIEQTILSVINQTYPNIEYIIIDGGSTDGTIDIIKKYESRITYWISESDKGIYDAMNKGIKSANGEWINFMNCGDTFYSNNVIIDVFKQARLTSDIIYGDTNIMLSIGNFVKKASVVSKNNYMPFGHQSSFSRTSLLKLFNFDLNFKICADSNFFYEAYNNNYKFEYVDIIIANYEAENGLSSERAIDLIYEKGKIEKKNHNLLWIIKFYLFKIKFNIKSYIKSVLPIKVVNFIRKSKVKIQ